MNFYLCGVVILSLKIINITQKGLSVYVKGARRSVVYIARGSYVSAPGSILRLCAPKVSQLSIHLRAPLPQ